MKMLNADLKQAVTSKAPARTKGQLLKTTTSYMRKLQISPERVKSYFEHAPVKYAALVQQFIAGSIRDAGKFSEQLAN